MIFITDTPEIETDDRLSANAAEVVIAEQSDHFASRTTNENKQELDDQVEKSNPLELDETIKQATERIVVTNNQQPLVDVLKMTNCLLAIVAVILFLMLLKH